MKKIILILLILKSVYMGNTQAQNPDFLFMVEQAVKAPSGHNTQPWLFKINESGIEIHPNLEKSLPVVDPDNRELFISLGCAAENLCVAALHKAYKPEVNITDSGVITIGLTKNSIGIPNPLFEQIAVRQTNRGVYNGERITDSVISTLQTNFFDTCANVYFYRNGTPEFDSILNYVVRGNTLQMGDSLFTKELRSWMRFNKKHSKSTNDGLSYAVFGAPNLPMFIVKPIMSNALNSKRQNKGDVKKMRSSSHFVLFTLQSNTLKEWVKLGMVLERFLLESTGMGIAHAYLNQPNEVKDLSVKMAEMLNISNEYPVILLRLGYAKKVAYSKRKNIEDVIIAD